MSRRHLGLQSAQGPHVSGGGVIIGQFPEASRFRNGSNHLFFLVCGYVHQVSVLCIMDCTGTDTSYLSGQIAFGQIMDEQSMSYGTISLCWQYSHIEKVRAMINVSKQVHCWLSCAREDWHMASICVEHGKARYALFFAHLTLEKALKAHVCRTTRKMPPKIHSLERLYEMAELPVNAHYNGILANINQFNIEGRYPELMPDEPDINSARSLLREAGEIYQWLIQQL